MTWLVRATYAVVFLTGIAACSGITGIDEPTDIWVAAELRDDGSVLATVHNRSANTILLDRNPCVIWVQRKERGDWQYYTSAATVCILVPIIHHIEPGAEYEIEIRATSWREGEYRFNVILTDEGHEPLPMNSRISNTIRIQ